jgi:3-oxoacyl-[acyl-carrier protein] reductase
MFDFSEKAVLVTGASRGIGRAIAQSFARCGARVAVNYRSDAKSAEETCAGLDGSRHITVQADVGSADGAAKAVKQSVDAFGRLDIVVNNAGIFLPHSPELTNYNEWSAAWNEIVNTNLIGPADICYHAARHMMEHGGGRIVNVSSRAAFRGEPSGPAYAASKAGLNALSQSLAISLAPHNIYVGVVAPGFVETDMAAELLDGPAGDEIRAQSPLGRVARAEEVAHAVLFLASDGAEFSTGTIIDVNGASYLRS